MCAETSPARQTHTPSPPSQAHAESSSLSVTKNLAHEKQERYVAEGFCKYYAEQFGLSCILLEIADSPDIHVRVGEKDVYLELAQYRETGARNDAFERDRALKKYLNCAWATDDSVNETSVTLNYRLKNQKYMMPRSESPLAATFLAELRSFVAGHAKTSKGKGRILRFRPAADWKNAKSVTRMDQFFERLERFPTLGGFCESIALIYQPGLRYATISSSLDAYSTAFDKREVQTLMSKKIMKIPNYRKKLGSDANLWLLIYSEGWRSVGRLFERNKDIETAKAVFKDLKKGPARFDQVWWGDELEQAQSGILVRLDKGAS